MFLSGEKLIASSDSQTVSVTSGKPRTREGKSLGPGGEVYVGGPEGDGARENTLVGSPQESDKEWPEAVGARSSR